MREKACRGKQFGSMQSIHLWVEDFHAHTDAICPLEGDEPDSSAPFGLRKFVEDGLVKLPREPVPIPGTVAFEVSNRGPVLTIEGALKVVLCDSIWVIRITLSGYLGDELTLTTEIHLQELVFVIKKSAP